MRVYEKAYDFGYFGLLMGCGMLITMVKMEKIKGAKL